MRAIAIVSRRIRHRMCSGGQLPDWPWRIWNQWIDRLGHAGPLAIILSGTLLVLGGSAWDSVSAQEAGEARPVTSESGHLSYPAGFFATFRPRTALDMIERLPGFVLDTGTAGLRGFGGAAGNVLVDGGRPTTKADGLEAALLRIPASQVERIDLIRGSAGAGEAAGQSVVANIVRIEGVYSSSWTAEFERAADGRVYPGGSESGATGSIFR